MSEKFQDCLGRGIELFNRREFYEAHEVWEEAWIDELSDDRQLLQGLIQAAAGFYKLQTGMPNGTVKLLDAALNKLRPFVGRSHGVGLEALLPALEQWLTEAKRMVADKVSDYEPAGIPRVSYAREPSA